MSKENKVNEDVNFEELMNIVKSNESSDWDGSWWIFVILIFLFGFGGWGSQPDNKDYELRERVARLEGQMSMIGGKEK